MEGVVRWFRGPLRRSALADDAERDLSILKIEIRNKKPVELTDLTAALNALSHQYQRYMSAHDDTFTRAESRLYIKEIRPGSIVAELIGYAASHSKEVAESVRAGVQVIGFEKQLKSDLHDLTEGSKRAEVLPARELRDLSKLVDVTAKDPGSVFHIEASQGGTVNVTLNVSSLEANTVQNQAGKLIEAKKEPDQTSLQRVLMYWHTASLGVSSNKGVIERVTDKPLTVIIENDEWRQRMLAGKENPLLIGFLVDVEVMYVQGKPKVYRITEFHQTVEE